MVIARSPGNRVSSSRRRASGASGHVDAQTLAWGVLGIARLGCTLATDRIVSKSEAGARALDAYAARWRPTILDCVAACHGNIQALPLARLENALAFHGGRHR
jgi:hypothetical protein